MASLKEAVIAYMKEKYGAPPENLWIRYPNYAIFRHEDSGKWFALMMDVEKSKLGLPGVSYCPGKLALPPHGRHAAPGGSMPLGG